MKSILVASVALVWSASSQAQTYPLRVEVQGCRGFTGQIGHRVGSAVCIVEHDDRWWFLTVGHAYRKDLGSRMLGSFVCVHCKISYRLF